MNALQYRRLQDKAAQPLFRRILAWFRLLGVPVTAPQTEMMAEHLWRPVLNARDRNYAAAVKYLRSQVSPIEIISIPAQPGYPLAGLTTLIGDTVARLVVDGDPITTANRNDQRVINLAEKRVERALVRHVQQPARETVETVAEDNDAWGWARMLTGPTSCGFCAMLASRGPIYTSARSAKLRGGASAEEFHDGCDCVVSLVADYGSWEGRQSFEMLEDLWQNTAKGSGKDARNAFRRSWDAKVRSGESASFVADVMNPPKAA